MKIYMKKINEILSFNLVKVHYPSILMPYLSNWVTELASGVPVSPLWLYIYRSGVVAPDRLLSMGQIEINCLLKLNWIAWDGTIFVC